MYQPKTRYIFATVSLLAIFYVTVVPSPFNQLGFDICGSTTSDSSSSKAEIALNVVWHIRTGDVKLHAEPTYFHTVLKYLKLALSSSPSTSDNSTSDSTTPNYRLQLVFESQERVEFLENMFPDAIFNIGIFTADNNGTSSNYNAFSLHLHQVGTSLTQCAPS